MWFICCLKPKRLNRIRVGFCRECVLKDLGNDGLVDFDIFHLDNVNIAALIDANHVRNAAFATATYLPCQKIDIAT